MLGSAAYPATFAFDPPERVANWRPLVSWLLAIPHFIVLYVLQIVSGIVAVVSWLVVLVTGRLPDGLAGVQAMYLRYALRTYTYAMFLRAEYPPFGFETTAADPGDDTRVRVDFEPQLTDRNRVTVLFRLFVAIPQLVVVSVLGFAAGLVTFAAFFAVLFTGRWPAGMRDFVLNVWRWWLRVETYVLLLTDLYPPFAFD